jgi:hypothetical protein
MVCAASSSGVVGAFDAELSVSSPFGTFLTFFCFAALILLVAFRLPFPVTLLALDARDLDDFVLEIVDWLGSRVFLVMVGEWGWGIFLQLLRLDTLAL